jgi:hypothetical protein
LKQYSFLPLFLLIFLLSPPTNGSLVLRSFTDGAGIFNYSDVVVVTSAVSVHQVATSLIVSDDGKMTSSEPFGQTFYYLKGVKLGFAKISSYDRNL